MTRNLERGAERQLRIQLETFASKMACEVIGPRMPGGVGFAFIAFDYGDGGNMAYCSSAKREDVALALRELLKQWESGSP